MKSTLDFLQSETATSEISAPVGAPASQDWGKHLGHRQVPQYRVGAWTITFDVELKENGPTPSEAK